MNILSKLKKHRNKIIILGLIGIVCGVLGLIYLKNSKSKFAYDIRQYVKGVLYNRTDFPKRKSVTDGLFGVIEQKWYVDNTETDTTKPIENMDNKVIVKTKEISRLFDFSNGFSIDLPQNTVYDFSKSPKFITAQGETFKAVISKERSVYEDTQYYIDYYFNRFVLDPSYGEANEIEIIEHTNSKNSELLTVKMNGLPSDTYDQYTYLFIRTNTRFFYRIMFKYNSNNNEMTQIIKEALAKFKFFESYGEPHYDLDYYPVSNKNWSKPTKELYNQIVDSKDIQWGIFSKDIYGEGIQKTIPEMEKKIDYKFSVILSYLPLTWEFPLEFMEKCAEDGRIVELTYQITDSNNGDLFGESPQLAVYKGKHEDRIRQFAQKAKEFGKPFLFRLNNEMNSDWTSYGGVVNLSDPDIYIANWRRIYEIFEEEGVDNAIWIFNPNDRDCPPTGWNSHLAYYPGNEYVHMFGITGYNNGNYYENVTGEYWREFDVIMAEMDTAYEDHFNKFPWIITEFSSSSIGGNKVKWIENMFKVLPEYPQIKIAVWFNYADYDFREGKEEIVARPYWLDETPETLESFRKGVAN